MPTTGPIPLPPQLAHLTQPTAPLHLPSADVWQLLEFWGFTQNGKEYLRKLKHCGTIQPVRMRHQRNHAWSTTAVLALWEAVRQPETCSRLPETPSDAR